MLSNATSLVPFLLLVTGIIGNGEQASPVDSVYGAFSTGKTSEEISEYNEIVSVNNRSVRNEKLSETDFYALSDVTMSSEMQTYRQALRDITTHSNWPHLEDSDWPTKP